MNNEKTMFRHVRVINHEKLVDSLMSGNQYNSIYDIPQEKKGTICLNYNDEEIKIGISLCSPKDNFSRKIGREIAYDRCMGNDIDYLNTQLTTAIDSLGFENDEELFNYCVKLLNVLEKFISSHYEDFIKGKFDLKSFKL